MKCMLCNTNDAVFHYKSTINGKVFETHLCSECAKQKGLYDAGSSNDIFSSYGELFETNGLFESFLGGILGQPHNGIQFSQNVCQKCGMTYSELMNAGKVGCSKCYEVFRRALNPSINKIHGNVQHNGKIPDVHKEQINKNKELDNLKNKLNSCIEKQDYEQAAQLRDKIKELEKEEGSI